MITTILEIGLSNALVATALAGIAFVVTRRMRPQWALAVWLLVLAKLLMPPLWTVPLASLRAPAPREEPAEFVSWSQAEQPVAFSTEASVVIPEAHFEPLPITESVVETPAKTVSFPALLLAAWGGGTLCWSVLAVWRIRGFSTLLKHTRPAPSALQAKVDALAAEIGLRRTPVLRITKRRIAPLIWAFSRRTTILLPAALVEQLSSEERRALLLHELTHLRRRDHLAKLLELAAVAVYWWLPTAWWARRQADRATEGCCDAEVVARLTGDARSYASALVKTIDYLSEATQPLPLGASGFSQFGLVSRRIEMILQPLPSRRASWKSRLAIVALCLLVLPISVRSLWADPTAPSSEPVIESEAALPSSGDENTPGAERTSDPLPIVSDVDQAARYQADLAIEHEGPVEYEENPQAKIIFPSGLQLSAEEQAPYAAKLNAFLKQYFGKKSLQGAHEELARLEQNATESRQLEMIEIRDHLRIRLAAVERKFAAGEVTVDTLIAVQQQFADREAAVARVVCSHNWSGEVLRMQANYMIACEAVNRARKTWKTVHQQTSAEPATGALAREHFYQCKQQLQNVHQAAIGDFGQYVTVADSDRDMEQERSAALGAEWRTYSITGSTTVGAKLARLDPPSDDDVLRALHRKHFSEGRSPAKGDIKIVKELRATYVDDPRVHPEIGQAQRHHAIYKCTVGYVEHEDKQTIEVFYIDHNHLHRFDQKSQQAQIGEPEAEAKPSEATPAGGEFILSSEQKKDWNSSETPMVDRAVFEAKIKSLAGEVKSSLAETHAVRRDAAARQVKAMQAAFEAGTVTIDQLLEAQRRYAEAQLSYYNNILPPDTNANRLLLYQAHLVVIGESLNSARRTWQQVYAKYRTAAAGGEPAIEAQAREQFYLFKSKYERARQDYQQALDERTSANQESNSQGSHQTSRENEEPFQAELNRVSVAGPVTTGEKVTPLDPPSDEEFVRALADQNSKVVRSLQGENHRIVKELVATYTDPPKWHPKLVGKGQLHHAHYRCTIYYDDPQGKPREEVVYVDHNHLHRKVDPRTFDEFQSGPFHHKLPRGVIKEAVQFRHFQLQLAREKAKLADLKRQIVDAPTAEQQADLSRLEILIAGRQQQLDLAARNVLQNALSSGQIARHK